MTKNKKIWLGVLVVLIIGAIWYLEAIQVHPSGTAGGGTPININATGTALTSSSPGISSMPPIGSSSSTMQEGLQAIAAADAKAGDQPAIEIADPTGFINATSGFNLANLIGKKVILLDFWTYSCINCIRTLPYLTSWYSKYGNEGLEIVGIHTPEFEFEKNINNVQAAVQQYGIQYPVVLDSNYGTWDAYGNLYWPHEYLIDIAGYIVHDQVGEGNYDETEAEIQKLLTQRDQVLGLPDNVSTGTVDVQNANLNEINSPETYFGAARNEYLGNGTQMQDGLQTLTAPSSASAQLNTLYLGGTWDFADQYATNVSSGAEVLYQYDAGKVYIVASASSSPVTLQVLQDGQPIPAADAGSDVHNGTVTISSSRLYNLVNNADGGGDHTLELIVNSPGLQAFTFTFG